MAAEQSISLSKMSAQADTPKLSIRSMREWELTTEQKHANWLKSALEIPDFVAKTWCYLSSTLSHYEQVTIHYDVYSLSLHLDGLYCEIIAQLACTNYFLTYFIKNIIPSICSGVNQGMFHHRNVPNVASHMLGGTIFIHSMEVYR